MKATLPLCHFAYQLSFSMPSAFLLYIEIYPCTEWVYICHSSHLTLWEISGMLVSHVQWLCFQRSDWPLDSERVSKCSKMEKNTAIWRLSKDSQYSVVWSVSTIPWIGTIFAYLPRHEMAEGLFRFARERVKERLPLGQSVKDVFSYLLVEDRVSKKYTEPELVVKSLMLSKTSQNLPTWTQ